MAPGSIVMPGSPAGSSSTGECGRQPTGANTTAVEAALERLRAALSAVADAEAWTAEERRRALESADQAGGVLAAVRATLLAAERAAGTWALHGDRSLAAWRARTSRQGASTGASQVRQADALTTLPRVAQALTAGAVTTTHLDAIARLTSGASPEVTRRVQSEEGQTHLVELAGRLDGAAFGKALAQWQAELDPVARQRAHDEQQAARYLHLSHTAGGTLVKGLLDAVAGHRLQLALEAVSPRPALDDDRSPEQCRADALVTLADRTLEAPATVTGATVRPHVSVLVSEATWTSLRMSRPGPGTPAGGAVQVAAAMVDHPPVCDEDGTPLPASEVARVLCDCRLTRMVLGADSVPLDLGRTQRLFSGAQRRAVIVRDGGCAWPSCPAAARWCELHHILWWDRDGGSSDLDNAALLCSYHHHLVHRKDLTITRRPLDRPGPSGRAARAHAGYRFTTPDGRTLAEPPPRGASRVVDEAAATDDVRHRQLVALGTREPRVAGARPPGSRPPESRPPGSRPPGSGPQQSGSAGSGSAGSGSARSGSARTGSAGSRSAGSGSAGSGSAGSGSPGHATDLTLWG